MKAFTHDISKELNDMGAFLEKRSGLIVRQYYLFEFTKDNELLVTASNDNGGITMKFPAQVSKPGKILVPPAISGLLAGLGDVISLTVDGHNELIIKAGTFDGSLKCLPAEEYPDLPGTNLRKPVKLEPAAFFQLLTVAGFADNKKEAGGSALENMQLKFTEGKKEKTMKVTASAADSVILATTTVKAMGSAGDQEMVIHHSGGEMLRVLLRNAGDAVRLYKGASHLVVKSGAISAWISFMQAQYPDLKPLFAPSYHCGGCGKGSRMHGVGKQQTCQHCQHLTPAEEVEKITPQAGVMELAEFKSGLQRVATHMAAGSLAGEGKGNTPLKNALLELEQYQVNVRYQVGTRHTSTMSLPWSSNEVEAIKIGFNLPALKKAVDLLAGLVNEASLTAAFTAATMPVMMRVDTDAGPFVSMVMPVLLDQVSVDQEAPKKAKAKKKKKAVEKRDSKQPELSAA
ncbi:MAG: hypothetical protein DWQ07_17585 [Chloroflexi bacterium]|nr:MAG: hypothetical protein DWQ07_17585 [Chloroflexota bacterium]